MRVVIVDCYTDEPAGLGVPPYIDIYPRYIAGAIWSVDPSVDIRYLTIDQIREDRKLLDLIRGATVVVVVAGVCTPGSYLRYRPATFEELELLANLSRGRLSIICGPVARFGFGIEGGDIAKPPEVFKKLYDLVITGDPDLVIYELFRNRLDTSKIDVSMKHESDKLINEFAVRGAAIVTQHPCYGKNLIAEIELYRSCPRYIVGGCSFCVTVRYGPVLMRDVKGVVKEVEALYRAGVRHFRLGRQADFYSYMGHDVGKVEFPRPNPGAIERLLHGIRTAAPDLKTLHIDNVNPGRNFSIHKGWLNGFTNDLKIRIDPIIVKVSIRNMGPEKLCIILSYSDNQVFRYGWCQVINRIS